MAKNENEKKEDTTKTPKSIYAPFEWGRWCPQCGKMSLMQRPQDAAEHWLGCSNCGATFRLELPHT